MEAEPGAAILAGGTDLLVQYQGGMRRPAAFLDIKRIPELMRIAADGDGVTIGAAVPAADIVGHPAVRASWPGLVEGASLIGSTQIQSRGSLGGNLCNGSPAADSTCALLVNDAVAIIAGRGGERRIPVADLLAGPGKTTLAPGELLVAIRLQNPPAHSADAYQRLIPRTEMDIAVAGVAVRLTLDQAGVCTAARVAIGAVAPTARLVDAAGAALVGSTLDAAALERAASAASAAAQPITDKRGSVDYRRTVVGVLTRRVAAVAAARAKER
ncbi:MAG: xanthine dehydrogenase family protein subunit M [Vicinamibacterales bacterium]